MRKGGKKKSGEKGKCGERRRINLEDNTVRRVEGIGKGLLLFKGKTAKR